MGTGLINAKVLVPFKFPYKLQCEVFNITYSDLFFPVPVPVPVPFKLCLIRPLVVCQIPSLICVALKIKVPLTKTVALTVSVNKAFRLKNKTMYESLPPKSW